MFKKSFGGSERGMEPTADTCWFVVVWIEENTPRESPEGR